MRKFGNIQKEATVNKKLVYGIVLLQILWVLYLFLFVQEYRHLPAPFLIDKADTFMDLYNPLYWSSDSGRYAEWKSVYPPLNFLILAVMRILVFGEIIFSDGFAMRDASLLPAAVISVMYVVAPVYLVRICEWKYQNAIIRFAFVFICITSAPMLFGLERGNLIILVLFLLPIILRSESWHGALALAVAINLKPYFAVLLFGYILAGHTLLFVQATCFAGAIFLLSGLTLDPNFLLLIPNLVGFGQSDVLFSGREVLALPSSVGAFAYALELYLKNKPGPDALSEILPIIPSLINFARAFLIIGFFAALVKARNQLDQPEIFIGLLVALISFSLSAGGYSQIFYLACLPFVATMRLGKINLLLMGATLLPLDLVVLGSEELAQAYSYIVGEVVAVHYQLGLGALIRPLCNMLLVLSFTYEFLWRENHKDISFAFKNERVA